MAEPPEISELLSGLDPPRPLPPALRGRLEGELTGASPARPLEPELAERLTVALEGGEEQEFAALFESLDAPRPVPAAVALRVGDRLLKRRARPGVRYQIAAGVAAACLLVAAVTGIALSQHSHSRPAATGSTRPAVTGGPLGASQPSGLGGASSTKSTAASGPAPAVAAGTDPNAFGGSAAATEAGTPAVTSVSPRSGPVAGRTLVTIRGIRLTGATAVRFGTTAALDLVVVSDTEVTVMAPPHVAGFVNVTVTTPRGTSPASPADRYTFTP